MKKIILFGCIFLLILTSLTQISSSNMISGNNTIYVDDDGSADYTRIQDAIDNANEGDTIFVYEGIYYENIIIDKSVYITGENSQMTIIDGAAYEFVVTVLNDYVMINGFTITNDVDGSPCLYNPEVYPGIRLLDVNNCTISENILEVDGGGIQIDNSLDCIIFNNNINSRRGSSIYIQNSYAIRLLNNTFYNCYYGMIIKDSTYLQILNNNFDRNGITLRGSNIDHWNTHDISNNTKNGKPIYYYKNTNNISITSDAGQILLANCSYIRIKNITFTNIHNDFEAYSSHDLIQLGFSSYCNINNNNISIDYIESSIYLYDCTHSNISDNLICTEKPGDTGIEIICCMNNSIYNNSILNYYIGIRVLNSNHNNIKCNNIVSIMQDIYLLSSSNNTLYKNDNIRNFIIYNSLDNSILKNHFSELYIYSSSRNIISNNSENRCITLYDSSYITLIGNNFPSGGGIIITGESEEFWNTHTMVQNYIYRKKIEYFSNIQNKIVSEDAGQVILANASNILIRNLSINSVRRPVQIGFSSHNIIDDNTLIGSEDCGIYIFSSENNIVSNNSMSGTGSTAVAAFYSMGNHIQDNSFMDNFMGVLLRYSEKNMIMKNNFQSNIIHAEFHYTAAKSNNKWIQNYWDDWIGFGPKLISGTVYPKFLSNGFWWPNFDWNPAEEPLIFQQGR